MAAGGDAAFATTHWSAVVTSGENGSAGAAALENLCSTYWFPLYAYLRRQGHAPEEAQDLTQAFFARLLERGYLANASPERGKFRTFLLTALQRFLINEWKKGSAQKRGGGVFLVPLYDEEAETRYSADSVDPVTPEKLFDKRWAMALLEQVLGKLEAECVAAGKAREFAEFRALLWGDGEVTPYVEVAAKLGMTEGALKVAVHRLKKRYRELLRAEVARTVITESDVDAELRHLKAVFSA